MTLNLRTKLGRQIYVSKLWGVLNPDKFQLRT